MAGSSLAYEVIDICLDHYYEENKLPSASDASSHGFQSRTSVVDRQYDNALQNLRGVIGEARQAKLKGQLETKNRQQSQSIDANQMMTNVPETIE